MGTNDIANQQAETTTLEWGEPIPVNGVRPDWLRDDESFRIRFDGEKNWSIRKLICLWPRIAAIRLPSDHPYYTVQRWNREHPGEVPLTYWPGGDEAPGDYDDRPGKSRVLFRGGPVSDKGGTWEWYRCKRDDDGEIIGYRKRAEADDYPTSGENASCTIIGSGYRERPVIFTPEGTFYSSPEPEWQPDPRTLKYVAQKLRDAGHGDAVEDVDALIPIPVYEDVALLRAVLAEWDKGCAGDKAERLLRGHYDNTRSFRTALAVYRKHKEGGRG